MYRSFICATLTKIWGHKCNCSDIKGVVQHEAEPMASVTRIDLENLTQPRSALWTNLMWPSTECCQSAATTPSQCPITLLAENMQPYWDCLWTGIDGISRICHQCPMAVIPTDLVEQDNCSRKPLLLSPEFTWSAIHYNWPCSLLKANHVPLIPAERQFL